MKKTRYIYKVKSKIKKHPELLAKYGFNPYACEGEEDNEIIYARGLTLKGDCSIVKYLKRAIEKIYTKATSKEREEDFAGLEFKEILTDDQQRDYEVVMNEELYKELTECQLCIPSSGLGEWSLFINAPDRVEYYNVAILNECAKEIVDVLLTDKVIYKAKIKLKI